MATDDTYNGWTNRETWALALWLNNDEGLQSWAYDVVAGVMQDNPQASPRRVGEAIVAAFDDDLPEIMSPDNYHTMRDDIGSVWRVDTLELGQAFASAYAESQS